MSLSIRHLPADVLGPPSWVGQTLAERPHPPSTPGVLVPASAGDVPPVPPAPDADARKELAQALEHGMAPYGPHVAALEATRKLADPRTAIVLAGQQPGLCGGPLYNVYKALHVVRLARELEQAWGTPVVAGFWNHADDHDVAEVHHVWIQNHNLDLRKVALAGFSSGRTPLGELAFDDEANKLADLAELLRHNLWEGPERDRVLELCLPRHGETFASAFSRILLGLYGHLGLVVIEPEWIRADLSRAVAHVVSQGARAALAEGTEDVRKSGREPAIDPEGAALVFHKVEGKRMALRFAEEAGESYRYDGEAGSRTATELAAEIVQAPNDWSPGALLRPVAQNLVLPVAAYVGGWGELDYHAQLAPLFRAAGLPAPVFVPRIGATVIDDAVRVSLRKLEVDPREALAARGRLGEETEDEEPSVAGAPVVSALRQLGERISTELVGLRDQLAQLDPGLAQQLKRSASQVRGLVDKLAQKAERVHANSQGRGRRHFRRVNNGLFPRNFPQERVRGPLEFFARYGTGWIDELVGEIDPFPTEHLLLNLQDEATP